MAIRGQARVDWLREFRRRVNCSLSVALTVLDKCPGKTPAEAAAGLGWTPPAPEAAEITRLRDDKAALLAALRGMLERYDERSAKPAVYCGKLLVGYVAREAAAAARAAIAAAERK